MSGWKNPRAVWRYEINQHRTTLQLPAAAQVVDFDTKDDEFCIWVMVHPDTDERESRTFVVFATGSRWEVDEWEYLRTCHDRFGDGQHEVWHLLEKRDL